MPGAAGRALVADHDDVAGLDLACFSTAAKHSSSDSKTRAGPGVGQALVAGDLDHAALGGEVAAQDHQAAGLLQRIVERADDLLALGLGRRVGLLADRAAGDGDRVAVQQPGLVEALGEQRRCRRRR